MKLSGQRKFRELYENLDAKVQEIHVDGYEYERRTR